jgi:hypothetical protein
MTVRDLFAANVKLLGKAKQSVSTAAFTYFDFGTPDDLNLAALSNYKHGDKILVIFTATTAGTTNMVSFGVEDAPDSNGSVGSSASASTDGVLTGGTSNQVAHTSVALKPGRPWLRFTAGSNGTTDTFAVTCAVYAISAGMI